MSASGVSLDHSGWLSSGFSIRFNGSGRKQVEKLKKSRYKAYQQYKSLSSERAVKQGDGLRSMYAARPSLLFTMISLSLVFGVVATAYT